MEVGGASQLVGLFVTSGQCFSIAEDREVRSAQLDSKLCTWSMLLLAGEATSEREAGSGPSP
eukprot:6233689-Pyramimonas_sp.AAC.1